MQTFLPYRSFAKSAQCLDRQRLGKQRVEVLQILRALTDPEYGWQHHPAVLMWRGYKCALVAYGTAICVEWRRRGYQDTCLEKIRAFGIGKVFFLPEWLGLPEFHASHRSNLLRKNPEHYGKFDWTEPADLPYMWPGLRYRRSFFTARSRA